MKKYDGHIEYNQGLKCYGMMGLDGVWIKEKLEDGDRIAIMIGDNVFETKFSTGLYTPALEPLPWDNLENLVGRPAVYYDFENTPDNPVKTKKVDKRYRFNSAILIILISIACNALLAAILSGISAASGDSFIDVFTNAFPLCFGMFGGSSIISAFMILATKIADDSALKYGAGFYYGTLLLTGFLSEYLHMGNILLSLILSAAIVSQACYIFWLKHNKQD